MRTVADEKGVAGEDVKACSLNQLHQSQGARAFSGEHVWVLLKDTAWDQNGDPLTLIDSQISTTCQLRLNISGEAQPAIWDNALQQ